MYTELYHVLGMMSGTSLDGLDLALCRFYRSEGTWNFEIADAETIPYPAVWTTKLSGAASLSGEELLHLHLAYGNYLGMLARDFLDRKGAEVDLIASHGHTVFHQPERNLSFQLGHGQSIAQASDCAIVWDFRQQDVLMGGQGAPLVPMGDRLLFGSWDACLNLGGISNISFEQDGNRVAFDICPVNMALNRLSSPLGLEYDAGGAFARKGNIDETLLVVLNKLEFYSRKGPRSLGREWFESFFLPLINEGQKDTHDLLATVCEHIAVQIGEVLKQHDIHQVLITGGGARNDYLLERIRGRSAANCIIPSPELIDFKEALVFAFLGLLRWIGEDNVLCSVTGSSRDHCAGLLSLP